MKLTILNKAKKDLDKLELKDKQNILDKIMLTKSGNTSNVKKLTNHEPSYRLRVGNYRVLFDIQDNVMIVARVFHRKEAYNK